MIDYKVGIIGCGKILQRHIESVNENENFELVALCDVQPQILDSVTKRFNVEGFLDYKKMASSSSVNFVVVASPNSLHVEQAKYCLAKGNDVLVEKPVSLDPSQVSELSNCAKKNGQKAYSVLQVRLNPAIQPTKKVLDLGLLGNIRGISLVQRWQRPYEYFSGWRSLPDIGGGTLYECGIHYLDILDQLLGLPKVVASSTYSTKHTSSEIEDTIYSIFDFGQFGGTMEVTVSAEPHNLECSLSILGSNGYLKLGGKAMNVIESANFLSNGCKVEYDNLLRTQNIPNKPNSYGSYAGSCPNHPQLYSSLGDFDIMQAKNSISLIDEIYSSAGLRYY